MNSSAVGTDVFVIDNPGVVLPFLALVMVALMIGLAWLWVREWNRERERNWERRG